MYSQNNEEKYITEYFAGRHGLSMKFLDIGAFHPFTFSNTRRLYESGWCGVFVEPSPVCFAAFEKEYDKDERVILIPALIAEKDGTCIFYDSQGDAVSTTNPEHVQKWQHHGVKYNQTEVAAISPEHFFGFVGEHFDFISIDTESTNVQVFNLIPDNVFRNASLVCVEHDNRDQVFLSRLEPMGYRIVHRNGENLIMGKST